jgi:hypothetical protein
VPSGLVGEVGEVVLEFVELPHATAESASMTTPTVDRVAREFLKTMVQGFATRVPSHTKLSLRLQQHRFERV